MAFFQNMFSPTSGGASSSPLTNNNNSGFLQPQQNTPKSPSASSVSSRLSFLPPPDQLIPSEPPTPSSALRPSFREPMIMLEEINNNNSAAGTGGINRKPPPPSPSLYPDNHPNAKEKLTPFSARLNVASEGDSVDNNNNQKGEGGGSKWLENMPLFSEAKRYRPSETWAAVSPNFPNLADVFPEEAKKRKQMLQQQQRQQQQRSNSPSKKGDIFSDFGFTGQSFDGVGAGDDYRSQSRSRSNMMNNNNNNNNDDNSSSIEDEPNGTANAVDYFRSVSEQKQKEKFLSNQRREGDHNVNTSFTNNNNNMSFASSFADAPPTNEDVEDFRLRSSSLATASAAARVRSFTGGNDFDNNPFATRIRSGGRSSSSPSSRRRNKGHHGSSISPSGASGGRGTVSSLYGQQQQQQKELEQNENNNNNHHHNNIFQNDDESADSSDADGVEKENPWIRNKLLSIGSTHNPNSARLFDKLAPERLEQERRQMKEEDLVRRSSKLSAKTKLRGANNLLPATPFSQKVSVLKGNLPNWVRRCEPARDLDAARNHGSMKSNHNNIKDAVHGDISNNNNNNLSDEDESSDEDEAIFDEFLLKEKEAAKHEQPRTERRGDFYRLNLQTNDHNNVSLRITEHAPESQKDPNEKALEMLAVSRPEFAPALRRLAPWQLQLIDWSSLFRGGTHQEVSITAKRFPSGAAWEASPFSEAPTSTGALGFVGNLAKREKESDFFSKLHGSYDGRVDESKMKDWMKKQPMRLTQHDDPF